MGRQMLRLTGVWAKSAVRRGLLGRRDGSPYDGVASPPPTPPGAAAPQPGNSGPARGRERSESRSSGCPGAAAPCPEPAGGLWC